MLSKGKAASIKVIPSLMSDRFDRGSRFRFLHKGALKNNEIDQRAMHMLEKVKAGGMAIGENRGLIQLIAVVETASEETCKQVESMIRGVKWH